MAKITHHLKKGKKLNIQGFFPTSDLPELDANFWEKAKLVTPLTKQAISLRVDSDVLDWFKNQGKGYQSLMNAVLRSYVEHHIKNS
ncbi:MULTISPECIES: BrnA antitoxin family protein [Planktothrix]|uniref:BrnA antitoxin family protein n=1 Tax=Planktothrix TaxID=54304 RepID=UPI001EF0ED46|nr:MULTISPECIES: BrnA antitoxin family protein [Planktothrix]